MIGTLDKYGIGYYRHFSGTFQLNAFNTTSVNCTGCCLVSCDDVATMPACFYVILTAHRIEEE